MSSLIAWILRWFRRPVEPPPVWERYAGTDVWHREMSAEELADDDRARRLRRRRRVEPEWLTRHRERW